MSLAATDAPPGIGMSVLSVQNSVSFFGEPVQSLSTAPGHRVLSSSCNLLADAAFDFRAGLVAWHLRSGCDWIAQSKDGDGR